MVRDVTNVQAVSEAIGGQDLVLSALGPGQNTEPVCEEGTRTIPAGMQARGVQRSVAKSGHSAADTHHGLHI